MWDSKNIGNEPYRRSDPIQKKTFTQNLKFYSSVFIDLLIFDFVVVKIFLKWLCFDLFSCKKKSIDGKLALVTGGANGIGRAIAIRLAREKCNVVIVDIDREAAYATADEIQRTYGVKCQGYHVDVTNYDDLIQLKETIKSEMGIVNILINNAGILTAISYREKCWKDIERILQVNLHSYIWTTRIFIDDMISGKDGHIVAMSSMLGLATSAYSATYCTSKQAVRAFMACIAEELELDGYDFVKTTCVFPYFVNTRKELYDYVKLRFPQLEPEHVADKIVDAILRNKETIVVAKFGIAIRLAALFPRSVQTAANTIIFKLRESLNLNERNLQSCQIN